ncbi:MAG: hypothetical protein AAGA23_21005, partial [Pseudomonadota bacterium]
MNNAPLGAGLPRSRFPGRPADLVRLTSLCALIVSATPAWTAEGGSLRLERNDAGSIIQAIAIDHWHFDATTGRLIVDTKDGNRRCGLSAAKSGAQTLVLDGFEYAIERFHVSGEKEKLVSVSPVIPGDMFPLCTVPSSTRSLWSSGVAKGPSGLSVEFDVLGVPPISLGIIGGIDYAVFGSPATISLTLADDVMCLQNGTQTGVRLAVTDTNGVATNYRGFDGLRYQPFGGSMGTSQPTLRATTDINPVCLAIPSVAEVVSQGTATGTCSEPDIYFRDGFEDGG